MSRVAGIIKRVDRALNKYAPLASRSVYRRVTTRSGGDDLIGRPGSVNIVDTLLAPQPTYRRRSLYTSVGDGQELDVNETAAVATDLVMFCSVTALTLGDLNNKDVQIILKDPSGSLELFEIYDFDPIGMQGVTVAWSIAIRSIQQDAPTANQVFGSSASGTQVSVGSAIMRVAEFTPDSSTTTFTLPLTPLGFVELVRNGLVQSTDEFSVSGRTITTSFVPQTGDTLYAVYLA